MDHGIGSVEYVVPVGDMLDVDKVDHAAIHESIQNIAGTTTDYETEADIFIAFDGGAEPEIGAHTDQQNNAYRGEYPAHALQHAKHAAVIADMSEVNQAVPFYSRVLGDGAIYPVSDQLRQSQHSQHDTNEPEHVACLIF